MVSLLSLSNIFKKFKHNRYSLPRLQDKMMAVMMFE